MYSYYNVNLIVVNDTKYTGLLQIGLIQQLNTSSLRKSMSVPLLIRFGGGGGGRLSGMVMGAVSSWLVMGTVPGSSTGMGAESSTVTLDVVFSRPAVASASSWTMGCTTPLSTPPPNNPSKTRRGVPNYI